MRPRDDAVIVAVGGVFAAAGLGVIAAAVIAVGTTDTSWCAGWFLGLSLPMAALMLIGGYMLTTPWHGARLVPKTQRERAATPNLKIARVVTHMVTQTRVVFQVGLVNDGPVDLVVHLNVLVPDFAEKIGLCRSDGRWAERGRPREPSSESVPGTEPEGAIYWDSGSQGIHVPANIAVPVYLGVGVSAPRRFPVFVKVFSSLLDRPLALVSEVGSDQVTT